MAYQNLFEALINVCGFTALEDDLTEIILAYKKDLAEQLSQNKRKIIGYKCPRQTNQRNSRQNKGGDK